MGNRPPLSKGEFYHIYNRGTEKRKIFLTKTDYERFLSLLYLANSSESIKIENIRRSERGSTLLTRALEVDRNEPLVAIVSYCLMPNHFHLLLHQQVDNGISRFMQKLVTAYTMYFNTKNERTGALFQGKFKSVHAGEDRYLKYLIAYIHLNPINPKERVTLDDYPYSSYSDLAGILRPQGKILNKTVLPNYFPTPKEFKKEIQGWIGYGSERGSTSLK